VQSVLSIITNVVSSNPVHAEVYSIQHYVIKFVSDLWQISGFLWVLQFLSTNKTDCHDITEILLKVALNTINQPTKTYSIIVTLTTRSLSQYKDPIGGDVFISC
jgi:hypothetical protein